MDPATGPPSPHPRREFTAKERSKRRSFRSVLFFAPFVPSRCNSFVVKPLKSFVPFVPARCNSFVVKRSAPPAQRDRRRGAPLPTRGSGGGEGSGFTARQPAGAWRRC